LHRSLPSFPTTTLFRSVYNYFLEEGADGVRYFHATSTQADSRAEGAEAVAIGPNTVAQGVSSFAAGDGASTTLTGEGAIALGQGDRKSTRLNSSHVKIS